MMSSCRLSCRSAVLLVILCGAWGAYAFNDPVDTAGPVTVRIEMPTLIEKLDMAMPVNVVVSNSGDEPLQGRVRLGVIDECRATPDAPAEFSLGPKAETRMAYSVVAGQGAFNVLYPIHAYVDCRTAGGVTHAPHAVGIVEVRTPNPPHPAKVIAWKPLVLEKDSQLALLESPVARGMVQVTGEEPITFAPGWFGMDARTRADLTPRRVGQPDEREALGIHPPWAEGRTGTALVEYAVQLPEGQPARLRFCNAVRNTLPGEPASDGVTYRVRVAAFDAPDGTLGDVVYERHTDTKTWTEGEADLSAYAGRAIRLQLESHPGPKNDTTCDASFWADPTLTVGSPDTSAKEGGEEFQLGALSVSGRRYAVSARTGARGLLDGAVTFEQEDGKRVSLSGFCAKVLGSSLSRTASATRLEAVHAEPVEHGVEVRHRMRAPDGSYDLVVRLALVNGVALNCAFRLENAPAPAPWRVFTIEDAALGRWDRRADAIYAGVGNVLRNPQSFTLGFDGHQLATSFVGCDFEDAFSIVQAVDMPPTSFEANPERRVYSLHAPLDATISLIPAPTSWKGAAIWRDLCGARAGGGVQRLAGRFAFDLWGGRYRESRDALERAFRYGLTDSVVVWHNWQRWGYDYRLPDIYPPNPDFGSEEDLRGMIDLCRARNVLFALHDNYIDRYPDAEGFTYREAAFTAQQEPVRAWLNEYRKAQAYRWLPTTYEAYMKRNMADIRRALNPTAYFIDVFSSAGPYECWSHDGAFIDRAVTRSIWGRTFDAIRDTLDGAPQISESGHDQLVGHLDGAQTNHLRVDPNPPPDGKYMTWVVNCEDAERTPWLDMVHHDRFALHGAGYDPRYRAGFGAALHGIYSDDYICTEVLDGHPGMVSEAFNRNVVRKYWLLHDLMRALAGKRMQDVEYEGGDIHRQRVRWDNGETRVNRGAKEWSTAEAVLPQYGFRASMDGVAAAIELKDGAFAEWSRSADAYYVNARPQFSDRVPVRVNLGACKNLGANRLAITLDWQADTPLDRDYRIFVHFVDDQGTIKFQADHDPSIPSSKWQGAFASSAEAQIPAEAEGKVYGVRVGVYRMWETSPLLEGPLDDGRRVRLGSIKVTKQGDGLGAAWTPEPEAAIPETERFNKPGCVVRFDGVETDGAVRFTREDGALRVTPLPDSAPCTLRFDADGLPFKAPAFARVEAVKEDGAVLTTGPVAREGGRVTVKCEPGVFAYRFIP